MPCFITNDKNIMVLFRQVSEQITANHRKNILPIVGFFLILRNHKSIIPVDEWKRGVPNEGLSKKNRR